jgi:hypothetical protein
LWWAKESGVNDQIDKLHWAAFEAGMRYATNTPASIPLAGMDNQRLDAGAAVVAFSTPRKSFDERSQRTIIEALRLFLTAEDQDRPQGLLVSEEIQNLIDTLEKDLAERES